MDCKKFFLCLLPKNIYGKCRSSAPPVIDTSVDEISECSSLGHIEDTKTPAVNINPIIKTLLNYSELDVYDNIYPLGESFYIAEFNNKLIFFSNNGRARLPLLGWFQECLNCKTITGKLYDYGTIDKLKIYIRMCERCRDNFDKIPQSEENKMLDNQIQRICRYV